MTESQTKHDPMPEELQRAGMEGRQMFRVHAEITNRKFAMPSELNSAEFKFQSMHVNASCTGTPGSQQRRPDQ